MRKSFQGMPSDMKAAMREFNAQVESVMRSVVPPRGGDALTECVWHHLDSGGKRLRPALCLAACKSLGGDVERAVHFAAAVELLHNMLLVHDDIEDGDTHRRERPTVWARYGVPHAINAGDYLLGLAMRAALKAETTISDKLRFLEALTEVFLKTVEGQAIDLEARGDAEFSIEKYFRLVELKTGYYLALGLVGGAIAAGCDEEVVDAMWELGKKLGPAFQMRDDVIDLTPGKGRGGEVGSDIREGKASILFAHALRAAGSSDREKLLGIMRSSRDDTSGEDVDWAVDLYRRCGSIEFAQSESRRLTCEAREVLGRLPLVGDGLLGKLVDHLTERKT